MSTPAEIERVLPKMFTDESSLWVVIEKLVAKGTSISLAASLEIFLRFLDVNAATLTDDDRHRILDRYEELIAE